MSTPNSSKTALIIGARSDIATATAHEFARGGYAIILAARNAPSLEEAKQDIAVRYDVAVQTAEFDVLATENYDAFLSGLDVLPDVTVCAVGYMGEQSENETDIAAQQLVMRSNFEGPAAILSLIAEKLEERGSGAIVGISSVAGDRGRATNYVYGSAKAGFTAFLSGLRNRLAKKGVHVVTVLPGFVATKMTEGMDLPAKLTAEPSELGAAIYAAVQKRRNVIYVRKVWWLIMLIIRNIPEAIFKKLSI